MRVLLSWLKDYVDVPWSVEELQERLPMLGFGDIAVQRLGDDAVLDLEIAANRGDLMSIVGVARELSAATRTALRLPRTDLMADRVPVTDLARVEVVVPELCPRYTARMIIDIQVKPSPGWMARRLEACGVRSINNIVDVTNYVMLEMGQPLHAFDYDRVHGGRIVVRRARPGEPLQTLDGIDRRLDPEALIIADAERAVGVAGVIGGSDVEIGPATRRVLLEAATFNPVSIRRTSKRLGVRTESSARFERGVDPAGVLAASARAIQLMAETAGGRILQGVVDLYPAPEGPRTLELRWRSVSRLLGIDVPVNEGVPILRSLGFVVEGSGQTLHVQVPSFRMDVEREEDLIEEVARHHGYDRIPETMPVEVTAQGSQVAVLEAEHLVREVMIRAGLTEVLTISLTNSAALDGLLLPDKHPWRAAVSIRNPLVEDHTQLRTSLVPGLLGVARVNATHRVSDVQIFEIGRTFHSAKGGVTERRRLALLLTGRLLRGAWNLPPEATTASYYHVKGIVEAFLDELRIKGATFASAQAPWLHPGRAAQISLDGATVGALGELHPQTAAAYDLPPGVYLADLDLEALLRHANFRPQFAPLPRFPSVRRDLAVVVPISVPASQVREVIAAEAGELLESAELFDVYTGPPVPPGHRNLAYALLFRSPDRTLDAGAVDAVLTRITRALRGRLRAEIRE